MNKARIVRIVLLALAALSAGAAGRTQDLRLTATRVADILAQFPAINGPRCERLAAELAGLGEAGIAEVTRQLVPGGGGRDTAARFAVNCLATWAGGFGREPARIVVEKSLTGALAAAADPEVKTFILSQLRLVGREPAVLATAPLFADEAMCEPATQLMLAVGNQAAIQALMNALAQAPGAGKATIVKALGELKAAGANRLILPYADAQNVNLRKAALAALAAIALPESYNALQKAAARAGYRYDPANATGALLAYARNLGEKGDLALSRKVCRLILKNCRDAERLPSGAAALAILAETGAYEALPDLLRAADHPDKAYRNAALGHAGGIGGVAATRRWLAMAQKSRPEVRAEIIGMFGRTGNVRAVPFLQSSLKAADAEVCLAAAEALAKIRKADAVADLLPLLKARPAEARAVAGILLWTMDERHLDPLAAMMEELPPASKAAAIGVIAALGGRRFAGNIFPLTGDPDPEIRKAAFASLKLLAASGDLPFLLRLLADAGDPAPGKEVQAAIVRAANLIEPPPARARPLLQAMPSYPRPELLLELLPRVGGAEALRAVAAQFEQPDPVLKAAAFRALVQWQDPEAAARLFAICASGDAAYRKEAFGGYLRLIGSSSMPAEQKLLGLRKLIPLASGAGERRSIVRALERIRTFPSFLCAARFLDDPEIASDAAGAVMRIALPSSSGSRDGLAGTAVRDALQRVLGILSGPESEYDKENIRSYLAGMPADPGFVPLFNGRDLAGWQGLVENPIARAKMTREELAARQAEADRKMLSNWSVRDGSIVFNGAGDNLCTVKEYGDFEMLVDWRITPGGDSGIYLRGSPQVQIWDPARVDVGAQVGSGGLYNNQKSESKPPARVDNPVGEWNSFRILMTGEKVTVYLNGVRVVDNVTMENYWDRKLPIFSRGPIELQAHGTDLAFRDLYVREVHESEFNLTPDEKAGGFISLFNGRDFSGWTGNLAGYQVAAGVMEYRPETGNRGNLYTEKEYADFQFRFEFQLTPGANSGVGIRAPLEGDAAYVGMEIQVLDDSAPIYANLQPYQYHGSVYGVIPCRRGFLKPAGEWNSEEIIARGSRIQVILNGTVIVDGDILEASRDGTIDHQAHPGLQRAAGHIGWLSHDSVVRFRNIRILDLSGPKR